MLVADMEKALELWHQGAEAGDATAQSDLGCCYSLGKGVPKDLVKAKGWNAKAAKQGNASAMYNLAKDLQDTEGDAAYPYSVALTRAAAEKGDAKARENLPMIEKRIRSRCLVCGTTAELGASLSVCGGCGAYAYCSRACAKKHWKKGGHKQVCKEAKKYLPEEEG